MHDDEFRAFYEDHSRRLWAYAVRLTADPAAAQDVVQEAFLRMMELPGLDAMSPEHRKHYLYKIASNLAKRGQPRHVELDSDAAHSTEAPMNDVVAVRTALGRMNARERGLLWLAYVERFSHREIGRILGYREGSVRPLLHRAKEKLVEILGGRPR